MNLFQIYLFLFASFVAANVSYDERCYKEFSMCFITSIDDKASNEDDKSKLTRSSAAKSCEANSSMLAIILNKTVESAMNKFIDEESAKLDSDIITNGYRFKENNWTWIGRQLSAPRPIVRNDTYRYAYIVFLPHRTHSLYDSPATSKRKFICSYVTYDSVCSYEYQRFESRCYKLIYRKVTWFEARNVCIQQDSELAIFESDTPSLASDRQEYWIGLRKESWDWIKGGNYVDMKYSNWDDGYPRSAAGDCLCLKARTGKWINCDCSTKYRYVCVQEMTTAVSTHSTSSSASTTTHTTPSVGDSTVQFHSTSSQMLDSNFSDKASGNPMHMPKPENFGMLIGLGVGSACLLILIIVIVVVVCIKNRRSRSGDHEPAHGNSPPPMTYHKDDAPNTVYAVVVANDDEPTRSPSEKTPNQTVYAELDLEPKGKITRRASQPVRYPSERTQDQSVYAEVDLIPRRKTLGRAVGQQESEVYANSLQVDSVYVNNAQTKV